MRNHPKGLDLPIAEGGVGLSIGQRQSIGWARLWLQDPVACLLDEPTAALDRTLESTLVSRLDTWVQGRTAVIATHRLPILHLADRTLILQSGRLAVEMAGMFDFEVNPLLEAESPDIVASERALLAARQADCVSRTEGARAIVAETARELAVLEDLHARDLAAPTEVTRARNAQTDAQNALNEIVTQTELDRAAAHSETLQEIATLRQDIRLAEDRLRRTTITAPMAGIVNSISVTTIGGVVHPGEEIAQITPLDDELHVEARLRPSDIAGAVPGRAATVKFTAYDDTIHGTIPGEVALISADTVRDETDPRAEPQYRVTVHVDSAALDARQSQIDLRAGCVADEELHTGQKTVLDDPAKPLTRGSEALREP